MPAEWERHDATWISWPANLTDWPGKITPVSWAFGEMARKISHGEMVHIIVNSAAHEAKAKRILQQAGVDFAQIRFFRFPSNRGWTRDSGPMFVQRTENRMWRLFVSGSQPGHGIPDWKKDDATPPRAAKALKLPIIPVRHKDRDVVLEGGSIDVNGKGTLLQRKNVFCIASVQVRNPGFTKERL